jgi:hypothetical protein
MTDPRRLRCRLGFHAWRFDYAVGLLTTYRCRDCGKERVSA